MKGDSMMRSAWTAVLSLVGQSVVAVWSSSPARKRGQVNGPLTTKDGQVCRLCSKASSVLCTLALLASGYAYPKVPIRGNSAPFAHVCTSDFADLRSARLEKKRQSTCSTLNALCIFHLGIHSRRLLDHSFLLLHQTNPQQWPVTT